MAENAVKHVTDEDFEATIASGIALVDFAAEWCGPCRMQAPVIEEFANDAPDGIVVVKVDVDQAQMTAARMEVSSIPTIIVFKDGQEVNRAVGLQDLEALQEMVSAIA